VRNFTSLLLGIDFGFINTLIFKLLQVHRKIHHHLPHLYEIHFKSAFN